MSESKSDPREALHPFERGRSQDVIRAAIAREVGEDYPLLGLIAELTGAVERDLRHALTQAAPPPATDANGAYLTWAELDALAQAAPPPAYDHTAFERDRRAIEAAQAAPPSGLDASVLEMRRRHEDYERRLGDGSDGQLGHTQAAPPPSEEELMAEMLVDRALAESAQAAPPPERVRPGGYLTPPFSAAQAAPPSGLTGDPREDLATIEAEERAAPPSGLDEEHCCGDLSHMSPEYIAALSPTPDE